MRKALFLLFQLVFVLSLNAQDNIRYTTCNLNMRSQANTSSEVILVIPQGTSVTIDEDCDCKWIPVTYNGQDRVRLDQIPQQRENLYKSPL